MRSARSEHAIQTETPLSFRERHVTIDAVLIGYNQGDHPQYLSSLRSSGVDQAAFRDARLASVRVDGVERTSMELLDAHWQHRGRRELSNADFVWPVISVLGSSLSRAGYSWDYVNLFHLEQDRLATLLANQSVGCVVITTTVYVSPHPILEIVARVRDLSPDTKIVVGGPYLADKPTTMPQSEVAHLLTLLGADYYVFSSEGEKTLNALLEAVVRGEGDVSDVPNLAYADGEGGWSFTSKKPEDNVLAESRVDWSQLRKDDIGQFISIRTAKSCPFKCAFCGFPERAGTYTYLPLEEVERELDAIAEIGDVTTLTFIDDTFNVPRRRFKEVLRMMVRKQYPFRWNSYLRSDHTDEECLDLMAQSGCEGVFLGVESGSEAQLEAMNKTARPEDYHRVITGCRERGIVTYASLIIGFPGENDETLAETRALLDSARPDFYRAQCWYADPFTPVFKDAEKHRLIGRGFTWSHTTMDSREASARVDEFFCTVDSSTWLPQQGFELWSVFYLQRMGLSLPAIKQYLAAFNAAVRHRVLAGDELGDVPAHLLAGIAAAADPDVSGLAVPPALRPPRVRAGIEHWRTSLRTTSDANDGVVVADLDGWRAARGDRSLPEGATTSHVVAAAVRAWDPMARELTVLCGPADALTPIVVGASDDEMQAATAIAAAAEHATTADFAIRLLSDQHRRVLTATLAVVEVGDLATTDVAEVQRQVALHRLGSTCEVVVLLDRSQRLVVVGHGGLSDDELTDLGDALISVHERAEVAAAVAVDVPGFDL